MVGFITLPATAGDERPPRPAFPARSQTRPRRAQRRLTSRPAPRRALSARRGRRALPRRQKGRVAPPAASLVTLRPVRVAVVGVRSSGRGRARRVCDRFAIVRSPRTRPVPTERPRSGSLRGPSTTSAVTPDDQLHWSDVSASTPPPSGGSSPGEQARQPPASPRARPSTRPRAPHQRCSRNIVRRPGRGTLRAARPRPPPRARAPARGPGGLETSDHISSRLSNSMRSVASSISKSSKRLKWRKAVS